MAAPEATAEALQRPTIWNPTAQAVRPPTTAAHAQQQSAFSQAAQLAYGDPAHLALLQQWYAYYSQHRGVPAVPGLDHAALDTVAAGVQRPGMKHARGHIPCDVFAIAQGAVTIQTAGVCRRCRISYATSRPDRRPSA